MDKITDEMLVSFADGELDAAERRLLASQLASQPELARRLGMFTITGRSLSGLYDPGMQEPVPVRLLEVVDRFGSTPEVGNADGLKSIFSSFYEGLKGGLHVRSSYWRNAIAFGLALVAGTAIGWQIKDIVSSDSQSRSAEIIAQGAFHEALEAERSGGSRRLTSMSTQEESSLKPILTFASRMGGFCREYQLVSENGRSFLGVACRNGQGAWRVRLHIPVRVQESQNSKIVPAAVRRSEVVNAVVEDIIVGDVLSLDEEASIIQGGWQQVP